MVTSYEICITQITLEQQGTERMRIPLLIFHNTEHISHDPQLVEFKDGNLRWGLSWALVTVKLEVVQQHRGSAP